MTSGSEPPKGSGPANDANTSVRTGVWFFPDRPALEMVSLAVAADDAGLDEFWIGDEGPAREPFSILAAAAMATERVTLAVGITNPYVRAPALTATTALTIHELSGGRMVLGVGAGGQHSLAPLGLAAHKPLTQLRSFISTVRAVCAGAPGQDYDPTGFSITANDAGAPLPLFVGARGRRLNELGSAVADGAFVAGLPPFRFSEVIGWARSSRDIDIALYPGVAFTEEAVERQRPNMIWGLLDTPDEVRDRLGLSREVVAAACEALATGDEGPARAVVTDELAKRLIVSGSPREVGCQLADLVREHRPTSIGLALTPKDPAAALASATTAFVSMREELKKKDRT